MLSLLCLIAVLKLTPATLAFPGAELFKRADCNADSCLRGLRAKSTATADCSSFLSKTVTDCNSAAITTTLYVTTSTEYRSTTYTPTYYSYIYTTASLTPGPAKRQAGSVCTPTTISPNSTPGYASACSGTARFSSACSCLGVTQSTTTANPSIKTTTISGAATIYSISTAPTTTVTATYTFYPGTGTFKLQLPDGRQLKTINREPKPVAAPNGTVHYLPYSSLEGGTVKQPSSAKYNEWIVAEPYTGDDPVIDRDLGPQGPRLVCQLSSPSTSSGRLFCKGPIANQNVFNLCNDRLFLSTAAKAGCSVVRIEAIASPF